MQIETYRKCLACSVVTYTKTKSHGKPLYIYINCINLFNSCKASPSLRPH